MINTKVYLQENKYANAILCGRQIPSYSKIRIFSRVKYENIQIHFEYSYLNTYCKFNYLKTDNIWNNLQNVILCYNFIYFMYSISKYILYLKCQIKSSSIYPFYTKIN